MSKMLSKSKIKDHSKCKMILWHELNQPELKVWDKDNVARFEQGRQVEAIARNMFPDSVLQDKAANLDKIAYTQELLKSNPKKTIFEAAFLYRNTIIQFDMLTQNSDGTFDAVEIKSSTSFKEDYELDVIIQYWVATKAGIKINKFEIWYVNNKSVSKDDYFAKADKTEFVQSNESLFESSLASAEETFKLEKPPEFKIGSHCEKFECPFRNTPQCHLTVEKNSVLALPRFRKAWDSFDSGIKEVNDPKFKETYPDYVKKNPLVYKSILENQLIIDREGLLKELATWKLPYNFMDFETLMLAIPILPNQKPYEQVVFQFSNHIYRGQDKLEHQMFLHTKIDECPDDKVIKNLLSFLNNEGSIISYNKTFEETRIKDLAKKYPEFSEQLLALIPRFVDLMDIIKNYVYHPDFEGSYSLKVVSPTLLKEFGSYSDSLIKSGSEIATYYSEMLTTQDESRKIEIEKALFRYCQYDTLNLFLVLKFLIDPNVDLSEIVKVNLEGA